MSFIALLIRRLRRAFVALPVLGQVFLSSAHGAANLLDVSDGRGYLAESLLGSQDGCRLLQPLAGRLELEGTDVCAYLQWISPRDAIVWLCVPSEPW